MKLRDYLAEEDLSSDELEEIMDALNASIASIQVQIDEHDALDEQDKEWRARAMFALRMKRNDLQVVQSEYGKVRRLEARERHLAAVREAEEARKRREAKGVSDERLFVRAAKSLLPEALYMSIWEEVGSMREEVA